MKMNQFSIQTPLMIIIFMVLTLLPTLHGIKREVEVKNQLEKVYLFIRGRGSYKDSFAKLPSKRILTVTLQETDESMRIVCCWKATKSVQGLKGEEKMEYFKGGNFVVFDDQIKKDCHDGVCKWEATEDALVFSSASGSKNSKLEYQWKEADETKTQKTCDDVWWDDEAHEFFKE